MRPRESERITKNPLPHPSLSCLRRQRRDLHEHTPPLSRCRPPCRQRMYLGPAPWHRDHGVEWQDERDRGKPLVDGSTQKRGSRRSNRRGPDRRDAAAAPPPRRRAASPRRRRRRRGDTTSPPRRCRRVDAAMTPPRRGGDVAPPRAPLAAAGQPHAPIRSQPQTQPRAPGLPPGRRAPRDRFPGRRNAAQPARTLLAAAGQPHHHHSVLSPHHAVSGGAARSRLLSASSPRAPTRGAQGCVCWPRRISASVAAFFPSPCLPSFLVCPLIPPGLRRGAPPARPKRDEFDR